MQLPLSLVLVVSFLPASWITASISLPVSQQEVRKQQIQKAETDRRFGLIVACTKYDHLPPSASLRGPANDVALMSNMLVDHFQFRKGNITVLADNVGKQSHRPLFKNIKREFKRLEDRSKAGDQIVVFLSGHGSQVPDDDPENSDDPEPDGMDEIFCPADLKAVLDSGSPNVENALRDDELRRWLDALRAKGASVWVIIDACHSGSAVRGTQVSRRLDPAVLTPPEILLRARERGTKARLLNSDVDLSSFDFSLDPDTTTKGGLVAIYAAQPHEPTFELPLPKDDPNALMRGLLTYTLVKAVTESQTVLTYTELVQRIHSDYVSTFGRLGPTPLIEGADRNKEILGKNTWPDRSRIVLSGKFIRQRVNIGRLHGINKGTVLAVFPPVGGESGSGPIGHVRVKVASLSDSLVEPCEFNGVPLNDELQPGARCEIVMVDYGEQRLKVAVDSGIKKDIKMEIKSLKELITFVDTPEEAQWILKSNKRGRYALVPAGGWAVESHGKSPTFGPVPVGVGLTDWLADSLGKISRASSLLRIAGAVNAQKRRGWSGRQRSAQVSLELLELDESDGSVESTVEWKPNGIQFSEGEQIAIKITNNNKFSIDFSLLFVDSGFGVTPVFPPEETVVDNRLPPGRSFTVGPLEIEGDSVGLEHMICIALRSKGQPVDFSWLAQNSLQQARAFAQSRSNTASSLKGALGQLLQSGVFGEHNTRGLKTVDSDDSHLSVLSWNVKSK